EQNAASGRIIDRAVIDRVAVHRSPETEVIPVGTEDHGLLAGLWIAPGDDSRDVPRVHLARLGAHRDMNPHAEWYGPKVARLRGPQQIFNRLAGQREQSPAGLLRHPAGDSKLRLAGGKLHVGLFPSPRIPHDIPSVARRR